MSAYARLHALWTLESIQALDDELIIAGLAHPRAEVRLDAMRLAETRLPDATVKAKLFELAADAHPRVEFQVACTLTRVPPQESMRLLQQIAARHVNDRWFQAAVLASASETVEPWFRFAIGLKQGA